jgi:preprotein translocase subunit YajC
MESVLNFFIDSASAQAAGGSATGGGLSALLFPIGLIVVFYFLLIRPQQKKQKEHRQMVETLGAGDEVVTGGGVLGKVTEVGEQFVVVEVADNVAIKVQKHTIATVLPKGTLKSV